LDALLLERLNSTSRTSVAPAALSPLSHNMVHELPLVYNGDFRALVSLRRSEEPAFNRYRHSLKTILRQLGPNPTASQVQEAIDTEVTPHLLKIEQALQANKEYLLGRAWRSGAITGALITVGAIAQTQAHLDIPTLASLATIPGVPGAAAITDLANATLTPSKIKEDSYYFLWKAKGGK